jgi:hypothetical protein
MHHAGAVPETTISRSGVLFLVDSSPSPTAGLNAHTAATTAVSKSFTSPSWRTIEPKRRPRENRATSILAGTTLPGGARKHWIARSSRSLAAWGSTREGSVVSFNGNDGIRLFSEHRRTIRSRHLHSFTSSCGKGFGAIKCRRPANARHIAARLHLPATHESVYSPAGMANRSHATLARNGKPARLCFPSPCQHRTPS